VNKRKGWQAHPLCTPKTEFMLKGVAMTGYKQFEGVYFAAFWSYLPLTRWRTFNNRPVHRPYILRSHPVRFELGGTNLEKYGPAFDKAEAESSTQDEQDIARYEIMHSAEAVKTNAERTGDTVLVCFASAVSMYMQAELDLKRGNNAATQPT
jgi:hypothetical protein